MKQDRFLVGILVFIGLLVVAAITLFVVRSYSPGYVTGDTPQAVVRNYAVAVQKGDYQRAYSYLADMDVKPSYDAFSSEFNTRQLDVSTAALVVGTVTRQSDLGTWVEVTVQYAGSGPFDSGYSNTDKAVLIKQQGYWRITYLPFPYFDLSWFQAVPTAMPVQP